MERTIKIKSNQIRRMMISTDCKVRPDLQVRCMDGAVDCEQKILTAYSPLFAKMDPGVSAIRIPDMSVEVFSAIIGFYQTGECALRRENLEALLRSANKLRFKELHSAVEKIVKSEAPGVLTVEEFLQGGASHESDDDDDEDEDDDDDSVCEISSKSPENFPSIRVTGPEVPGWGCVSSESYDEDGLHESMNEGIDEGVEMTPEVVRPSFESPRRPGRPPLSIPRADRTRPHPLGKHGRKPRWTDEEVEALKEIFPRFKNKNGRKLDYPGIAAAMKAQGFRRGTEHVKLKIYRLQKEEGLII